VNVGNTLEDTMNKSIGSIKAFEAIRLKLQDYELQASWR
jgi:hypothetical protein